jgi:putative endopeptidase
MRLSLAASALLLTGGLVMSASAQNPMGDPIANAVFAALASPLDIPTGPSAPPKKPVSFDLSSIDKTADPCTDFYQYACGNWLKANPISDHPSDVRWGKFNELGERNQYLLYKELESAAAAPKTPLQTKYGNYYAACMNVDLADKLGAKPIEPELTAIDALSDKKGIAQLDVTLEDKYGSGGLLGVGVGQDQKDSSKQILQTGQGGLSLPDRDYYLNPAPRFEKLRTEYVAHVTRMFVLLGDSDEKAATEAADVMRIETALAKGSMDRVAMRDPAARYHIMTIAQAQALTPDFDWHTLLTGIGVGQAQTLNVSSPQFLTTVNTQIESETLAALKSYLRWHALHGTASSLSKPFVEENFAFFNQTLNGQKEEQPRWKRCTRLTDGALGEAVGQDWVKQNFPPEAKQNMELLVAALKKSLEQDIETLPWMSEQTKQQAELKLAAFRQKIGYPAKWRDYSTLTVRRDDFVGNEERNSIFERERNLHKLGQPVDETEWGMTPPTVNAYYSPSFNDINFPAGILQPPFYDNHATPAINFGGIGVVIGHEMTHGFDDQGSKYGPTGSVKYNVDGSLGSWFTPADQVKFDERTKCIADEYSGFNVAPGQNLNGRLTLGENAADNGGLRIAYQALQEVLAKQGVNPTGKTDDGYTPDQKFFISFGQIWCQTQTEQSAINSAKTDPHSSGKYRTDGTVQNFDAFGKAFGCKVGQPMMPEKSCRVW